MIQKPIVLFLWGAMLAGCSMHDSAAEVEQHKLALELIRTQHAQLEKKLAILKSREAMLKQREDELRALESKNQEALQRVNEKASRLKAEEKQMTEERKRFRSDELENCQALQELAEANRDIERRLLAVRECFSTDN